MRNFGGLLGLRALSSIGILEFLSSMLSLSKAGAGILLYFTYDFFPLSSEPYIFPFPSTSFFMTPNLKEIVPHSKLILLPILLKKCLPKTASSTLAHFQECLIPDLITCPQYLSYCVRSFTLGLWYHCFPNSRLPTHFCLILSSA